MGVSRSNSLIRIESRVLLVVEGKDEKFFFEALTDRLGVPDVQVIDVGGKTKLRDRLKALALTPDFAQVTSLGVVRDADLSAESAMQSVQDALRASGLPVPSHPLISTRSHPRVTVMVLPDGVSPGMLEDLCLWAVGDDPAWPCVEAYFECLIAKQVPVRHPAKARVQAFLASRSEAGRLLGQAAQAGDWPLEHPAFDDVRRFVNLLTSAE